MLRQSSRIKRKREPITQVQEDNNEDKSDSEEPRKRKTTRKRRKANYTTYANDNVTSTSTSTIQRPDPSNVRGRRGLLQYMNEMPIDILYEIFGELALIDLLYLSWSCKSLQEILMDKQARFLWNKAYKALHSMHNGLPPCPSDLNLAQYTRFLFVQRCMFCHEGKNYHESWGLRLRVCWKCLQTEHFTTDPHKFLEDAYPGIWAKNQRFYLKKDFEAFSSNLTDTDRRRELELQVVQRLEGEKLYTKWKSAVDADKEKERDQVRDARRQAIWERLNQLGWTKEDVLKYNEGLPVNNLPTFNKVSKLTDKEWNKCRPAILSAVEELKVKWQRKRVIDNAHRLWTIIRSWKWQSCYRYSEQITMFRADDYEFMFHEPFMSLILDSTKRLQPVLDEETKATLENINTECLRRRNAILYTLLPKSLTKGSEEMDDPYQVLRLATVWFSDVERNSCPQGYTRTIQNTIQYPLSRKCHPDDPPLLEQLQKGGWSNIVEPWELNSTRFIFDDKVHKLTRRLLQLCHMDPDSTTTEAMNSRGAKFFCTLCRPGKYKKFTWKSTIDHTFARHNDIDWDNIFCLYSDGLPSE